MFFPFRLGQACNHIAALLFYIEHHANDPELPAEISKTSKPMAWHQPPKKTVPSAYASNIKFVKPCHGDDLQPSSQLLHRCSFDPRHPQHRKINHSSVDLLLAQVQKTMPNTGLLQFWQSKPCTDHTIPTTEEITMLWNYVIFSHQKITSITRDKFFMPSVVDCHGYLREMKITQDIVDTIEMATREQSECELWYALRNGRLTSSKFGEILRRRPSTDSRRLVRDIMGYSKPMQHLPPQIRWGKQNEDKARQLYIENRKTVGEVMQVTCCGLHLMPERSFLGATSDGKVVCTSVDTSCTGCLEIKCPYSIENTVTIELSPDDIAREFGDKFFMKKGDDGNLHLPSDHQYYSQVQGEMAIIGVEWCDFVVYSNGCVIVDRILADLDYWNNLMEKLEHFYVTHVIPEILSGRIFMEEFGTTA